MADDSSKLPLLLASAVSFSFISCIMSFGALTIYSSMNPPAAPKKNKPKPKPNTNKPNKPNNKPSTMPPLESVSIAYEIPEGTKHTCPPGKRGVVGYDGRWRDGTTYMWCADQPNFKAIGINDKLSYLSVPQGMKATLYENINYAGLSKTFEAGEWDLHDQKFDNGHQLHDRASSIKVEGTLPNASYGAPTLFDESRYTLPRA